MTAVRRFAVLTDRPISAWQRRCLEALGASESVTIVRWLQRSTPDGGQSLGGPPTGPLAAAAAPASLAGLEPEDADRALVAEGPASDVLLDLSGTAGPATPPWAGELWRFRFGTMGRTDADRTALIDYVRGAPFTKVALVRQGDGAVLAQGWVQPGMWWRGERLARMLGSAAGWPAAVAARPGGPGPGSDTGPLLDGSSPMPEPLLRTAAVGRRMVDVSRALLWHDEWTIGVADMALEDVLRGGTVASVRWLPVRPGTYAADPFGVERDGALHVLFELFDQRAGRGTIAHVSVHDDGSTSEPVVVLDPGVHASYPFLVEHDGTVFLLPETSAAGELVLYEATVFPYGWRRAATLLAGVPAIDPSIVRYADRWWLFAGRADAGDNDQLFVWHADEITGPWVAHAANPVKTDARAARSAGTPLVIDGVVHRPAQNHVGGYGRRVIVNRIEVLTPDQFVERPVRRIEPVAGSAYGAGLHTVSGVGRRTLVDGKRMTFVPDAFVREASRRIRGRSAAS